MFRRRKVRKPVTTTKIVIGKYDAELCRKWEDISQQVEDDPFRAAEAFFPYLVATLPMVSQHTSEFARMLEKMTIERLEFRTILFYKSIYHQRNKCSPDIEWWKNPSLCGNGIHPNIVFTMVKVPGTLCKAHVFMVTDEEEALRITQQFLDEERWNRLRSKLKN